MPSPEPVPESPEIIPGKGIEPASGAADSMQWRSTVLRDGRKLRWEGFDIPKSDLAERVFGLNTSVNSGVLWSRATAPDIDVMNARSQQAILGGHSSYEQDFRVVREGRLFWVHETVSIKAIDADTWQAIGVVTDITADREAQNVQRTSEEEVQQILKVADCLLWRARVFQRRSEQEADWVLYIPRSSLYRKLFGCDPPEHPTELWNTKMVPQLPEMNQRASVAILTGETEYEQEFRVHLDNRVLTMHEHVSVEYLLPGEWSLTGILMDVTERDRLEQELVRSSRLESVGILAGGIAHDYNNILTAIMGNISMSMLDAEPGSELSKCLKEAERATRSARDLTQQLLTFAKGGEPVRAAVDLAAVVRDVSDFALHGSLVKCAFDMPADLWPVDADKGQIGRVVQNLVINAVQAMPDGGTVKITGANEVVKGAGRPTFVPGDYVHISVSDSGVGICPEILSRIFDPYFTTKKSGSGLGLAVAYSIVTKHRGHIDVESEPGKGTTFHFWLPALRGGRPTVEQGTHGALKTLQGRVLFMDDEESIRKMAAALLKRIGLEFVTVNDGREAVEQFKTARAEGKPFDLVIMDLTVPGGMGGREALRLLREIDPKVKAVVSSGYSSDPVMANFRDYGFCGMVPKPYEVNKFGDVIGEALGFGDRSLGETG